MDCKEAGPYQHVSTICDTNVKRREASQKRKGYKQMCFSSCLEQVHTCGVRGQVTTGYSTGGHERSSEMLLVGCAQVGTSAHAGCWQGVHS